MYFMSKYGVSYNVLARIYVCECCVCVYENMMAALTQLLK